MVHIEYDGIRRNLDHLALSEQAALVREVELYARSGMRPPMLSVIIAGVDVTKQPELWPASERNYRGAGRLEIVAVPTSEATPTLAPWQWRTSKR